MGCADFNEEYEDFSFQTFDDMQPLETMSLFEPSSPNSFAILDSQPFEYLQPSSPSPQQDFSTLGEMDLSLSLSSCSTPQSCPEISIPSEPSNLPTLSISQPDVPYNPVEFKYAGLLQEAPKVNENPPKNDVEDTSDCSIAPSPTSTGQKFKYSKFLLDALNVDFEEMFASPDFLSNGSFEGDVYSFYLLNSGLKRQKWAKIFDATMKEWRLFGNNGYTMVLLARYSILRVIEVSECTVVSDDLNCGSLPGRMRKILKEYCDHEVVALSSEKVFQTLLWFFGKYKDVATKDELEAIKLKCSAEPSDMKVSVANNHKSAPSARPQVSIGTKNNISNRSLNLKNNSHATVQEGSGNGNNFNISVSRANNKFVINFGENFEASNFQTLEYSAKTVVIPTKASTISSSSTHPSYPPTLKDSEHQDYSMSSAKPNVNAVYTGNSNTTVQESMNQDANRSYDSYNESSDQQPYYPNLFCPPANAPYLNHYYNHQDYYNVPHSFIPLPQMQATSNNNAMVQNYQVPTFSSGSNSTPSEYFANTPANSHNYSLSADYYFPIKLYPSSPQEQQVMEGQPPQKKRRTQS